MAPEHSTPALAAAMPGLWRLCVLDVFVGNPDRHIDNLLFRPSELDGRWTFIAIDWGKALWNSGFPSAPVEHVARSGNTAATIAFLRSAGQADPKMTLDVVARLQALRVESLRAHLDQLPAGARCPQTDALVDWWSAQDRLERLQRTLEVLS
ncbi:phosphatidylinositol 4-kinase [Calidifontimicrobium sp. SYSU G02091]|uniref:phosphatidylinositol 4-kinase n=1 Tax=Calidifontimicrobium sp. SYSU G02091 TaxID=2926421 RepID=UPI001F52F08A|nr:phosphatidylinositol 4-kinase [Calidifontimicrobium sp. SYSU G02091]MCI1193521.1 phosphatidylinositol 4-kinase [Calidifontimicrobium sp. SYSU G02091]